VSQGEPWLGENKARQNSVINKASCMFIGKAMGSKTLLQQSPPVLTLGAS